MKRKRTKIIRLPISRHIDVNFRNYALYVLENRGIPNWYDSLTNVQRLIMLNSKSTFDKTLSLMGECIKDGYHHGDNSLKGAINKLAKPVNCADSLLEGDGFFGSAVKETAAAPRYTSIKINPDYSKIIKENSFLNSKNEEGNWQPLYINLPIGLTTLITGIGVGYKSFILPRNIKDVEKFLNGKIKNIKPYFKNFKGKIKKYQNLDKTWLIEGKFEYDDKLKFVHITDLPPMMKYEKFLKKLNKIIEDHEGNFKIKNNSSFEIDIKINFKGQDKEWEHFKNILYKATKMLVTETPVFIKDGVVIQYDKIEDYILDFKYRVAQIDFKRAEYFYNEICFELDYNKAKKKYLEFMLLKKRTEKDVDSFLEKYEKKIATKLNNLLLRFLNEDELKRVAEKIKELEKEKKEKNKTLNNFKKIFESTKDTTSGKGIKNKASKDLLDDIDDIDGIEFFKGENIDIPDFEDEEEEIEN